MSLMNRLRGASFGRRLRQLGQIARHPWRHWRTLRLLMSARREGVAASDDLSTGWKYLGDYLAAGFGTAERAALIMSHYAYLLERLPRNELRRDWAGSMILWERRAGDVRYAIALGQAMVCPMEGEAQLCFYRDAARLFTLTFSLIDGPLLGLSGERAMFIGGMQGGYACQQENRAAARDNGEVAPATMLVLAARAVAEALGVAHIAAVSSRRQASASYASEKIRFRYDDWWEQLGSRRIADGLFLLDPPGAGQRSLSHLSAAHRKRALRKTRLKAELAAEMRTAFRRRLTAPAVTPAVPVRPGRSLPRLRQRGWTPQPA